MKKRSGYGGKQDYLGDRIAILAGMRDVDRERARYIVRARFNLVRDRLHCDSLGSAPWILKVQTSSLQFSSRANKKMFQARPKTPNPMTIGGKLIASASGVSLS